MAGTTGDWMGSGHIDKEQEPAAAEILQEAQRRIDARKQKSIPPRKRKTIVDANHVIFWLSNHWVALFNVLIGLFFGGAHHRTSLHALWVIPHRQSFLCIL